MIPLTVCWTITILICIQSSQADKQSEYRCLNVLPFCRNLTEATNYSKMTVPNGLNQRTETEIMEGLRDWEPLVGQCHHRLKLFLCGIFAPICIPVQIGENEHVIPIRVCRSFCSTIRDSCEPVMQMHNHSWPDVDVFNCSTYEDNDMCLDPGKKNICDQTDAVLKERFESCHLVIKAVVNKITDAKTQGYGTLIKLKRHQRRKVKKTNDFPDRVLVDNDGGCQGDLREHVRTGHQYLIMLEKISPSKKKSKYIVSAIVPWNKKYRSYTRRPYCGGGR